MSGHHGVVLCKAVFPTSHLVALLLHLGFKYALYFYHCFTPLLIFGFPYFQKLILSVIMKNNYYLQLYYFITKLTHIYLYNTIYRNINNVNNNVTYLNQKSLCMVTLSLYISFFKSCNKNLIIFWVVSFYIYAAFISAYIVSMT